MLGGGIGFSQRLQGLACDQLVETEIVIASGELLRCNEVDNADLFWACRGGGGGNFGVNTSLTFQTFPVAVVTVFRLVWRSGLDELLPAARLRYCRQLPVGSAASFSSRPAKTSSWNWSGSWWGPKAS